MRVWLWYAKTVYPRVGGGTKAGGGGACLVALVILLFVGLCASGFGRYRMPVPVRVAGGLDGLHSWTGPYATIVVSLV